MDEVELLASASPSPAGNRQQDRAAKGGKSQEETAQGGQHISNSFNPLQ